MIRQGVVCPLQPLPHFESLIWKKIFMPYKSGLIQAALGAIGAFAFIISNWSGKPESKHRQVSGVVQKIDDRRFCIQDGSGKKNEFELGSDATIYLNDRKISLAEVPAGRTATVQYEKRKRQNLAKLVDVFPTPEDTDA